jgi:hypothetical protein
MHALPRPRVVDPSQPDDPLERALLDLAAVVIGDDDPEDALDLSTAILLGAELALVIARDSPDVAGRVLAQLAAGDDLRCLALRDRIVADFVAQFRHHT